jgi:hypothetical protein
MSRRASAIAMVCALLAAWLAPTPARAQLPSGGQSPAPPVHPGTKLAFPITLGGAKLEQSVYFPAVPGTRDADYTYVYSAGRMQIFVELFDGGRRAPSGIGSPLLAAQFDAALGETERQLKTGGFTRFERSTVASTCTYGSVAFRCIVFSAVGGMNRLYSKLLMTGFRDSYVKIHVDWSQATSQTLADADKVLNEFVPALMH